jgi:hypothetical protein
MKIVGPICVLMLYVMVVSFYWHWAARDNSAYNRRWYLNWICKGLVLPLVIWFLLNVGHNPVMPAIVKVTPRRNIAPPPMIVYPNGASPNNPNVQPIVIPNKPKYIGVGPVAYVIIQTAPAFAAVGSYWGALTLTWFAVAAGRRAEDRRKFVWCSIIWGTAMLPFVLLLLWPHDIRMLGLALTLWSAPVLHYSLSLESAPKPLPHYTNAIVKIKFGKYAEAEQAIISELEKCENDFDGWLMLAELYARQFKDIGEAERTVRDLCNDPNTTLSQKSVALHKLADWHLQFHQDPLSARRVLEEITKRMPGTHLSRMAQLRHRQLPASTQEWIENQGHGKKVKMPALNDSLEDAANQSNASQDPKEAERAANQCVDKLKRDPNDVATRERLARIFAERMGQAGLGINQLELLMEMPEQSPHKMAEWLSLMAAWQIKYRDDKDAGQRLLRRLITEFPNSAQAFAAQRRLKLMEMEARS